MHTDCRHRGLFATRQQRLVRCSLSAALAGTSHSSNRGAVERQVHIHANNDWHGMPAEQFAMDISVHVCLPDCDTVALLTSAGHVLYLGSLHCSYDG